MYNSPTAIVTVLLCAAAATVLIADVIELADVVSVVNVPVPADHPVIRFEPSDPD
ncbi:MAG: hypothetical protein UW18_C0019G0001 [Microgenomates group bacterium GW2011_GWF1_44_10]|nr:MAG: hypothetical protein UW18_C0019G0001 [Microgenomates group bacterium GW2011_GWF1_44_10]